MKITKILGVLTLAVLMASCCPCRKSNPGSASAFVDKEWKLIQKGSTVLPNREMDNYTLSFSNDGKVTGMGDCNRFSGSYIYSVSKKIDIMQLASTRMGCLDMTAENEYLDFLRNADYISVDGNLLVMEIQKGQKLIFEQVKK